MKTYIKDVKSLADWLTEIREWRNLHGAREFSQTRHSDDCVEVRMWVPQSGGFDRRIHRPDDWGRPNVAIMARGLARLGFTFGDLPTR